MKQLLSYFGFVLACLAVIAIFVTATSYTQVAVAIALYVFLLCIALVLYSQRSNRTTPLVIQPPAPTPLQGVSSQAQGPVPSTGEGSNFGISDFDKRVFLKLIGSTGVFLFIYSLLNKKTENVFFRNMSGPTGPTQTKLSLEDIQGNKIDPAQNQPMDGYRITDIDADIISYYGFTNKDGSWYIMRNDTTAGSFRYAKGDTNFSSGWTGRQNLKYDYFSNVF